MPRIPIYQSQVSTPESVPNVRADAVGVINPMQGIAEGASKLVNAYDKKVEEDGRAYSAKALSDARVQWADNLEQRKLEIQPGASGFAGQVLTDYDKYMNQAVENAPDRYSKKFIQQGLDRYRSELYGHASTFEAHESYKWKDQQYTDATDNIAKIAGSDPVGALTSFAELRSTLEASQYPEMAAKHLRRANEVIPYAAVLSDIPKNPDATLADINKALGVQPPKVVDFSSQPSAQDAFGKMAGEQGLTPAQTRLARSFYQQESGSGQADTSKPNYAGALGPMQVTQPTFDGMRSKGMIPADWQWENKDHSTRAGLTLIKSLDDKYSGDPRKVAAAYYSGEKAVGADGSIVNYSDPKNPNAPTTLQYADAVVGRLNKATPPALPVDSTSIALVDPISTPEGKPQSTGNVWIDSLSPQQLMQLRGQAQTEVNHRLAEGRLSFNDRLNDSKAKALAGIPDQNPISAADFGKYYPEDRSSIAYRDYQSTQALAQSMSQLKMASPQDVMMLRQHIQPDPNKPGYAESAQNMQHFEMAWARIQKQREDDSAAYVLQNSTAVSGAYGAMIKANTPEQVVIASQNYAKQQLSAQQALGISNQAILPKAVADSITEQMLDTSNGGSDPAKAISAASQRWGAYWPSVFSQLKDLPPVYKLMGYMGDTIDPVTRSLVVQTGGMKLQKLEEGLPSADIKASKELLQGKFAPFGQTLSFQPGGLESGGILFESAQKLALTYMHQGKDPSAAAADAYQRMVANQYEIRDQYRVPKQYNADLVSLGSNAIIHALDAYPFDTSTVGFPQGMRQSDQQEQYVSRMKSPVNHMWLTSADGKGLVLYSTSTMKPVKLKDGRDFKFNFEDMESAGMANAPTIHDPATGWAIGGQ